VRTSPDGFRTVRLEEVGLFRLREKYLNEVVPAMMSQFGYKSIMAVPRIEKVVLNMGLGEAIYNIKVLDKGVEELTLIAGQKAVITKAKRSIAGFKLREGMPIGCMVTLRHSRMYAFLDKLFNVALPRVRDFQGISSKIFDGRANCSIGIKEHIIFPEVDYDKIDKIKGLNISIVTTASTDEEGRFLLKQLGMPFRS
jgi:large subunit ribosomal protein L5